MEETPVRRKKKVAAGSNDSNGTTPPPAKTPTTSGPYCPKCRHEYGPGAIEKTQAQLAVEAELAVECPTCSKKAVPVTKFFSDDAPPTKSPKIAPVHPGVQRIIESVFNVDFEGTWKVLHEQLVIGDQRNDHGTVNAHLDRAEDHARKAHQLWCKMKLEFEEFKIKNELIWSAMWDEANAMLQTEKDEKKRNKAITDADVRYKMAEQHPDEFHRVQMREKEFEIAVKHAENLVDRWSARARHDDTMLSKMRGGGVS